MFFKRVFKIGQHYRNPSLQKWFFFLKATEKWTLEELKAYQLKKLQELLVDAYNQSSYYKIAFNKNNITPSDISSLDDLKKIPIITKKELIAYNLEIHSTTIFNKVFNANTSGTSGASLKFKREESADSFNRASIFRGYSWYHVNPWETNGYFWGFNFEGFSKWKTKLMDKLQNRFRLFSYKKEDVAMFIGKLRNATYLHGYSSMIYETAKLINSQNLKKPLNLKMVKGTSEKIYEGYQEEVKKAYGVKMISEYGAAETGIIAFECTKGNMHVNMEGVIVEELENEIVVTNLQMSSFPIIRYRLGDYVKLAVKDKKCGCGMQHQIIEEVTGRIGELVYGLQQTYPSLYFYYIFKNLGTKHALFLTYQVIQNTKGSLVFFIEQCLNEVELKMLKNEIMIYFKNDINFDIQHSQTIVAKGKKLKSFISNIE